MRHSLTEQGFGVRLRPVTLEDASFIVWLRNLDSVLGWVGDSAADVASQEIWLNRYFDREGDYYFIIETSSGIPLGTHSVYNRRGNRAEIGRVVTRPGVSASYPAAVLLIDLSYGQMGITELEAICPAGNYGVLTTYRRYGFNQVDAGPDTRIIGGTPVEMLHFVQRSEDWPRIREIGMPAVLRAESTIRKWEKEYLEQHGSAPIDAMR